MKLEIVNVQGMILGEIATKSMKRNDIALSYALCMVSSEPVDWAVVNKAIIERWSVAGLTYIKERAWRIRREG